MKAERISRRDWRSFAPRADRELFDRREGTRRREERVKRKAFRFSPSGDMSRAQLRRLTESGIPVQRRAKTGTSVLRTI